MIIPRTRLKQHRRILRELEGIQAKFSFKKCVLRTPAVLETVLGKSSAIPVCLSESCLSHDVTRALCYSIQRFHEAKNILGDYRHFNETPEHEIELLT